MYQLEVKRWLVEYLFPPNDGWKVLVDVDAMERATGGTHARQEGARHCGGGCVAEARSEFGQSSTVWPRRRGSRAP